LCTLLFLSFFAITSNDVPLLGLILLKVCILFPTMAAMKLPCKGMIGAGGLSLKLCVIFKVPICHVWFFTASVEVIVITGGRLYN
jgi:hypothetical protein